MADETAFQAMRATARDILADLVMDPTYDASPESLSTRLDLSATVSLVLTAEFGDRDGAEHVVSLLAPIMVNVAGRPRSPSQKDAVPQLYEAAIAYAQSLAE